MKTYQVLFILFILPYSLFAQDVIVKKDGTKIEAKVIEITPTMVRYRNFTQPEGPDRSISTSSLKEIVYEDGQFDDFSKIPEVSVAPTQPAPRQPNSMNRERVVKDPLLSSGVFIDGLIGFAQLNRQDYQQDVYYIDQWGNYIFSPGPTSFTTNYLSIGFRLGTKWYFGENEKWRPGLQVNWIRLGIYLDPDDAGSLFIGPKNLSICNVGMANIIKFNDKMGLELNFTTGLNMGVDLDYGRMDIGIGITPEVKFRYKKLALGLDYSHIQGISSTTNFRGDIWNQLSISIGAKF